MTPKYSAQWWEKVTARPRPIEAKHDAPSTTTCSIAPMDQRGNSANKTKARESVWPQQLEDEEAELVSGDLVNRTCMPFS
jgi:hypothetical protein